MAETFRRRKKGKRAARKPSVFARLPLEIESDDAPGFPPRVRFGSSACKSYMEVEHLLVAPFVRPREIIFRVSARRTVRTEAA